jgi:hypothetical protein
VLDVQVPGELGRRHVLSGGLAHSATS